MERRHRRKIIRIETAPDCGKQPHIEQRIEMQKAAGCRLAVVHGFRGLRRSELLVVPGRSRRVQHKSDQGHVIEEKERAREPPERAPVFQLPPQDSHEENRRDKE